MAIAAVDVALWDLKARLLGLPLCQLLGMARDRVPVYGSGGFTAYPLTAAGRAARRAGSSEGIPRVKMKVGSIPDAGSRAGARRARRRSGASAELFVDANGAYTPQAGARAGRALPGRGAGELVRGAGVLRRPRRVCAWCATALRRAWRSPPASTATTLPYFERMLEAGAVDVLQADVTRCAGITELLRVDGLCRAHSLPLSLHCGPAIHLHPALALAQLVHLEYFHDHVRIEQMLFDGVVAPRDGALHPDLERPGNRARAQARRRRERYAA